MDRSLRTSTVKRRVHSLFRQGCLLYDLISNMPEERLRPNLRPRLNEGMREVLRLISARRILSQWPSATSASYDWGKLGGEFMAFQDEGTSTMSNAVSHLRSKPRTAESWPISELESVDFCPLCKSADRKVLYKGLTDRVFFCAPGEWDLYRCGRCGTGYLDPRPTVASIGLAYKSYYTHEPEGGAPEFDGKARSLKASLRNGYT